MCLNEFRAVTCRGLEYQVKMVRHQNEHIEADVILLHPFGQAIKKALTISIILKQSAPRVTQHSAGYVVDRSRIFNS